MKEDWKKETEKWKVNIEFLENYMGAYDLSKAYNLLRIHDYSHIVFSAILIKENKFDLVADSLKMLPDNYLYLQEFYDFLHFPKTGRIWNETIEYSSIFS